MLSLMSTYVEIVDEEIVGKFYSELVRRQDILAVVDNKGGAVRTCVSKRDSIPFSLKYPRQAERTSGASQSREKRVKSEYFVLPELYKDSNARQRGKKIPGTA
ncbi:hypothetical protein SUGI_0998710 [Cryptomeria japonica]|nr:hypothetical protein SUGI_0998710 [Cryptomeria japonica]